MPLSQLFSISLALYSYASMATLMLLWMATMGQWLHSDYMNTLSRWSCMTVVDEVHSKALIYQDLDIPSFCIPPVWPVILHHHTDITTWSKANIACKIFISKIKYLKMLKIYLSAINIKFQYNFPSFWQRQVLHLSVQLYRKTSWKL